MSSIDSIYIPPDINAAVQEHEEGVQSGITCRVSELDGTLAWMRGFVNGWYGWANDGKSMMLDYLSVLKAKFDGWKICMYKQEDMDTIIIDGKPRIRANRIYKNLMWTYSGKTWNENFAKRHRVQRMTLEEELEILEFIEKHFYVIYLKDRSFQNLMDSFRRMYEIYGIDMFILDPFNTIRLPENQRGDERLVEAFIAIKEFAMESNSVFNIVNHPRSMTDVKEKDGKYKVVNQFMQLGGSAWDMKMDAQFSVYRPERHIDPKDPKVHLYNLKQKQAEIVGASRGSYEKIVFDPVKRQYYFNNVNPITGEVKGQGVQGNVFNKQQDWTAKKSEDDDTMPF